MKKLLLSLAVLSMGSGLVASAEKPVELTIGNYTGKKLTVKIFSADNNGINAKALDSKKLDNEVGLVTDFQGKCARFMVEKKAYKAHLKDASSKRVTIKITEKTKSGSDVFEKNDKVKIDYLGEVDWSKDKNKNIGATC